MLSLAIISVFVWPWRTLFVVSVFVFVLYLLWQALKKTPRERWARRLSLGALIFVCFSSPYIAYKVWELRAAFARIPEPLRSVWIEYRQEVEFGVGFMPGDNETGFVVYRLTNASTRWARSQGKKLGESLPGGSADWHPTPVGRIGDVGQWTRQCDGIIGCQNGDLLAVSNYLDKYGFSIPLPDGVDADVDQAIRSEGSFYSYGSGGAVTVVDPNRGKVYFAYAG